MTYTFVETCAGTAALSFALMGVKPPVPMAGSKRTLAKQIIEVMGLTEPPGAIVLNDPSEWGNTLQTLFSVHGLGGKGWDRVAAWFASWLSEDERELFDRLRRSPPPTEPYERAATHLYLSTRTFRGKPVFSRSERSGWVTHGFDPEYRAAVTPGAKDRGWFNGREQLASKLRMLAMVPWPLVHVFGRHAQKLYPSVTDEVGSFPNLPHLPPLPTNQRPPPVSVVYIDPPYASTNKVEYECEFPRSDVIALARRAATSGCSVFVSEAEPVAELVDDGWESVPLTTRRKGTQLAVHDEYLTFRRAP